MVIRTVARAAAGLAVAVGLSVALHPVQAFAFSENLLGPCALGALPAEREVACSKAIAAAGQGSDSGILLYFRAMAKADQGHASDALTDLGVATLRDPSLWTAWAALGDLEFSRRHYPQALEAWNRVVALKPDSSVGYSGRSAVLERMNRYEEGVADATKALELAGEHDRTGESLLTRGNLYEGQGRFDLGIADMQEAIKRKPKGGDNYYALGRMLLQKGDAKAAEQALTKALELSPDDQYSSLWLYMAQSRLGGDAIGQLRLRDAAAKDSVWPGPIIQVILGKIPENQAVFTPEVTELGWSADQQKTGALCEMNFFLGEKALIDGDKTQAVERFKAAVATGIQEFLEYRAAQKELAALGSR